MHELSVAQALVEQVQALVVQHGAQGVARIRLRIGPLAGVVPDLLATAFPLAAAGTALQDAELECLPSPLRVRCQACMPSSLRADRRMTGAGLARWRR